jgi:hypothetical protein
VNNEMEDTVGKNYSPERTVREVASATAQCSSWQIAAESLRETGWGDQRTLNKNKYKTEKQIPGPST